MEIIDISMDLNEQTVVWRDDAPPELRPVCRIPQGQCNFTWLNFSAHAGTHVDAPFYLFSDQWTSDQIPLTRLLGRCQVLDLSGCNGVITAVDLAAQTILERRVLLKTKNSFDPLQSYNPQHVSLDSSAARFLVQKGVETVGYDYQSFEQEGANELHRIFLQDNVTLIDNLRLGHVAVGLYQLICLPLKVTGIDAAPARAVLIKEGL